jgi:hypothetical protein
MIQRYKVFAKLQTAQDYETFQEGLISESHCLDMADGQMNTIFADV